MNEIKHRISLDVSRAGVQTTIPFVRGDINAHTIIATLRNGAEPLRFDESELGSISVQFLMRRGNTDICNTCELIPVGADPEVYNAVVYNVTSQTLAEEGLFKARFVITSGGRLTYSPEFQISVLANDGSGLQGIEDELTSMQSALDGCNACLEQMEDLQGNIQEDYSNVVQGLENKVDKTNLSEHQGYAVLYGQNSGGNDTTYKLHASKVNGSVMRRDDNGRSDVEDPDPNNDYNIVNVGYADRNYVHQANRFHTGTKVLYGQDEKNIETFIPAAENVLHDSVMLRDADGRSNVNDPDPTVFTNVANVSYVNKEISKNKTYVDDNFVHKDKQKSTVLYGHTKGGVDTTYVLSAGNTTDGGSVMRRDSDNRSSVGYPDSNNPDNVANVKYVKDEIANLVGSAPETLDTIHELAAALGDDKDATTTIVEHLAKKVNKATDATAENPRGNNIVYGQTSNGVEKQFKVVTDGEQDGDIVSSDYVKNAIANASLGGGGSPESLDAVKDYVNKTHYGYSGDDLLIIPEGTTEIAEYAYKSAAYKCIIIPDTVTTVGNCAFQACRNLKSITFPESVTSFGVTVLDNCVMLESVKLPGHMAEIPYAFFYSNRKLSQIELPESITSIGKWSFYNCTVLKSITIPKRVTHIHDGAFEGCTKLAQVDFTQFGLTEAFPTLGTGVFKNTSSNLQILIPKGRKAELLAMENWSTWANDIVEVPTTESLDVAYGDVSTKITNTDAEIQRLSYKVANITSDIDEYFIDEVYRTQRINCPENALPYVEILKLGSGTPKVSPNIFDVGSIENYDGRGAEIQNNGFFFVVSDATLGSDQEPYMINTRLKYPSGPYELSFKKENDPNDPYHTFNARVLFRLYDSDGNEIDGSYGNVFAPSESFAYSDCYHAWFNRTLAYSMIIPESVSYWQLGFAVGFGEDGDTTGTGECRISDIALSLIAKDYAGVEYHPYIKGIQYVVPVEVRITDSPTSGDTGFSCFKLSDSVIASLPDYGVGLPETDGNYLSWENADKEGCVYEHLYHEFTLDSQNHWFPDGENMIYTDDYAGMIDPAAALFANYVGDINGITCRLSMNLGANGRIYLFDANWDSKELSFYDYAINALDLFYENGNPLVFVAKLTEKYQEHISNVNVTLDNFVEHETTSGVITQILIRCLGQSETDSSEYTSDPYSLIGWQKRSNTSGT